MNDNNFAWTRQYDANVLEVTTHELIDEQTVRQFSDAIDEMRASGVQRITIDMHQVEMLSSMAICVLVNNDRKLRAQGGELHIQNARSTCLEVFSFMRLHEVLNIEASQELVA